MTQLMKPALAAVVGIFMAAALTPSLRGQGAAQSTTAPNPPKSDAQPTQQPRQPEAPMPASGHATTLPEKTFSGQILTENGRAVLKDPVTKVSYKLSDSKRAAQFEGQQVKVTGKLDPNSSTIEMSAIEPVR